MSLVFCPAVTGLCFSLLEKRIRRRPVSFCLFFMLLSLLDISLLKQLTVSLPAYLVNRLLRYGVFADSMLLWVMYAIILSQKGRPRRVMMTPRAQVVIGVSILTLAHSIAYG